MRSMSIVHVFYWSSLFTLSLGFQGSFNPHGTSSRSRSTCLYDAPEPLAEEGTWQAFLDEDTTGLVYYFDTKSGESLWEPPTSSFPLVRLPRRKQRLADNLRREYRKARAEMMDGSDSDSDQNNDGEGFFSAVTAILEVGDTEEEQQQQQKQTLDSKTQKEEEDEESGWGNLFGGSKKEVIDDDTAPVQDDEPKKGFFGGIFGGKDEENVETDIQQDDNKNGFFANLQRQTQQESSTTTKVEKKPEVEKIEEKIIAIQIDMGSHILPHPAKVKWGGEDATFIKGRTFGVFDGVSGAEKLDGVPLYSRTLASEMKKMVSDNGDTVQDLTAYLATAASYADSAATGASTAVVASIGENGFLQALNVGDSACYVIRDAKITAKTREISHYWECPYQLSEDSPDQPKDGTKLNVELIPGDVIIMGSDGIFDNMSDDILLDTIVNSSALKPTPLAKKICDVSRTLSLDKNSVTPYSKQAKRRGDADYRDGLGGKVDDVSCIVVVCK
jgi:protein phosphatase PTC7